MTSPETLFFDIQGVENVLPAHRIACYQWGSEHAARTAVCVHGLTRNGRDFDFLAAALADKGWRVLCPDIPGRGLSSWLPLAAAYNYGTYVATMQTLFTLLKLTSVDWIGTSMGGIIGMTMANTAPGVIRSLVLNDIGTVVAAAGLKRILNYAGVKMEFATRREAEEALRVICAPFGITDERHWQHFFTHSLRDVPGGVVFSYDPKITAAFPADKPIEDIDLSGLWEGVKKMPVLLIRGEQSDILLRQSALDMQAAHPNLMLREIPNTGHAPALMSEAQIALIADWLNHF